MLSSVIHTASHGLEGAPPVAVNVVRGDMVESRHRASYAVVDADGAFLASAGDVQTPVYARSAIKPIQALPIVETGAAAALRIADAELALACASHGGEPMHVEAVRGLLARLGLGDGDLECGAHLPYHAPSAHALIRAGQEPASVHNNCSGKHAGMLATARHMGEKLRGYIDPAHPVQQRVVRTLEEMCGLSLRDAPRGTDGCSLPQIGIPLAALARAMSRFGAPDGLAPTRRAACRRIAGAMLGNPLMVAGTGRFCSLVLEICGGAALVKTGAEGVYMAAIPGKGLGIALKIEDGATRAAEVVMARLLACYADLPPERRARLEALTRPALANASGRTVGHIAPAASF